MKTKKSYAPGGGRGGGEEGRVAWVQVRRGKNPRQGESLDEDKRQDRRHAGRPADSLLQMKYDEA